MSKRILPFVLFFGSGAAALVYEVVWIRVLSLTLSVTVYALTLVLCTFMGGLGLGAALAARFADRVERPLVVFGVVELAIAGTGIVVPEILYGLGPAYVWITESFGADPVGFTVARFGLAFGVLMVPTILMGTTLPLLSRAVIEREDAVGAGAGALYAINTVGAVAGCALAGFALVPELGLTTTSLWAAALNVTVGILAVTTGWRRRSPLPKASPAVGPVPPPSRSVVVACLAFAVSGFTAMGYEILWTRALEPFTHNSTYAYSAMLTMFLLGLGLGSAVASRLADRLRDPLRALGWVEIGIGAAVTGALAIYLRFDGLVPVLAEGLGGLDTWPRAMALIFSETALTLFLTTLLFGATFPFVARAAVESVEGVGSRIGIAYTSNTLGSILGSACVGFAVLPALGVRGAFVALIATNLALGVALLLWRTPLRRALGGLAAAAGVAVVVVLTVPADAFEQPFLRRFGSVLFYKEEVTDTVMVTEDEKGGRMIRYADGRGTAGTITFTEDRMYAHIPLMLHPEPRRMLQIAFGVGNSLSSAMQYPLEHVDCVELSPGALAAAPYFAETNRNVLHDPRVRLVISDGRNYLLASRDTYDVIRLDPPELHTAGVVNLYTREFFEMARDHLAPGGIFSIWVNAVMTPDDDLRKLVRTIRAVFPHVSVWHGPARYSWVINGSMTPHPIDVAQIVEKLRDPAIRRDLASTGVKGALHFVWHVALVDEEVDAFAGDVPLVTDDHTYLDFSVARSRESSFGIGNQATGNWLSEFLDPERRKDSHLQVFFRRINELMAHKQPVLPHLAGLEEAGLDRAEVAARLESFGKPPPRR